MNEMRGRWISLNEVFREHENAAARYMSDRDERLRTSTDVEAGEGRRGSDPETESEDHR